MQRFLKTQKSNNILCQQTKKKKYLINLTSIPNKNLSEN